MALKFFQPDHGLADFLGGGADGVGRATTNTVYASAIGVLVCDFFITKLFIML